MTKRIKITEEDFTKIEGDDGVWYLGIDIGLEESQQYDDIKNKILQDQEFYNQYHKMVELIDFEVYERCLPELHEQREIYEKAKKWDELQIACYLTSFLSFHSTYSAFYRYHLHTKVG